MRAALSILLMVLVLVQPLSKFVVIVHFQLQQRYIAENLCVNRFTPGSTCNGKCYLSKKLKEEAGSRSSLPSFAKEKGEVVYCFETTETVDFPLLAERHDGGLPVCFALPLRRGVDVFHPPSLCA